MWTEHLTAKISNQSEIRLVPCGRRQKRKAHFSGQLSPTQKKSPLDPVVFHPYVEWKSAAAV